MGSNYGSNPRTLENLIQNQAARVEEQKAQKAEMKFRQPGQGLEFMDLSYTVLKKQKKDGKMVKKQVNLLQDISGQALKGQVTAVLGPSGAGKSTFLDALAGRIAKGSLGGSVSVDGRQMTASHLKRISSYVMQDDQLFPMLTVYETFMFAAKVRLPSSMSELEKKNRVEKLLEQLGLQSAAHTKIGDEGRRGVSGGERRRVSIGVDIMHGPYLLFLDEPTSGLDSTSAFSVVEKVKDIARAGSIVILTIHQPSFRIQQLLDSLIILARGRLIYLGSPNALTSYLEAFGRDVPEGENNIEYLLDVIKEYDESTLGLDPLVDFQRSGQAPTEAMKTPLPKTPISQLKSNTFTTIDGIRTPAHETMSYYEEDEENYDNSLVRKTPLNNFGHPKLASEFYKNFSIWLYNEMVDTFKPTPGPPSWTPARTPGMVSIQTSVGTPGWRSRGDPHREERSVTRNHNGLPKLALSHSSQQMTTEIDPGTPYPDSIFSADMSGEEEEYVPKFANPWSKEVAVLMWRNLLNIVRTPELFLSREIVFTVMSIMLATLFKKLNKQDNIEMAYNLVNFFIFTVCLLFFSSNDAVPTFIQERYIFIRETSHNAYRASSYVVSSFLVYLPFFAVQALTFTVLTYFFMGLRPGGVVMFWLVLYASLVTSNSYVTFVSAMVPNYITGYAIVIASTALFFLTCGFFLKRSQIPKIWIWLHYVSAIKYPFEALLINQFEGRDDFCYSTTLTLPPGPLGNVTQTDKHVTRPKGCKIIGQDILHTMDITQTHVLFDLVVLLGWGMFYRLLFYVILRFYSKNQRK